MNVTPSPRPDWFIWRDPPLEWCQANVELPGLRPVMMGARMAVEFHVSHFPCLPVEVEHAASRLRRVVGLRPRTNLLRPYQHDDFAFLGDLRGALLAYEMRLGKTPLACHLHDPRTGVLVIVSPLAARESWREWVGRTFDTGLVCLEGRTNVEPQPGFPAYFCHYQVLGAHSDFLSAQRIGTLVLDEVHTLQGKGTQRMSAVSVLAPHSNKILSLSGTPVWNKPKSLYPFLTMMAPGAWGTQFEYRRRYCNAQPGAHGWTYEGASNTDELQARLAMISVRRTWKSVAPELPPTTRIVEPVELTGAQFTAIETAAMRAALARGASNVAGYQATLRRKMAAVKIKPAVEAARQAARDGHKVVLWVWHNSISDETTELLHKASEGFPTYRLQSSDSANVRDWNVQAFRDEPGPAYLVAAMGVGGVGLDLSCSDYAIFIEYDWTPANVLQAEKRTFHMSRPDVVVYFYADSPTEAALVAALDIKNEFASALGFGPDEIVQMALNHVAG